MRFEPIAIVGQSCTLPGAHSPEALWENVLGGVSSLSHVPAGRWGMPHDAAMGTVEEFLDRTWSDVGGYVTGFKFDASGMALPAGELQALDPLFQLTLHGVRQALRNAGIEGSQANTGLVLGNLSYPSAAQARYAECIWLDKSPRPHARNRFNSGLPALLVARALGLGGGAFALDAACASSLFAIKMACDRLHDRTADRMVAGAVNQADDLFIHAGFCALSALSRTGRSRPFHRDADGLVPAEGAGFVVLERLADARAAGREILGVIRGVGLSNDGRGRGMLAPSEEGQERAFRAAYAQSGLSPADVSLLECHATGTPVGDATELRSMARVFSSCRGVPIGSLKSNLGHLITVAGVAGLIKVLAAMKHSIMPPTLHADEPTVALDGTPFRLLHQAEPWNGPKRAGVSAFGFGGNNAHLIVESLEETLKTPDEAGLPAPAAEPVIAIVGVGARVGRGQDCRDFADELLGGKASNAPRETVSVALEGLRFPPNDLEESLAQQTLVLEAAREAAQGLSLPRERTSVLIGMGCDPEAARYGARLRLANISTDPAWLAEAREGIVPTVHAAGVVGRMPNIPANRINSQLDLGGAACTVSAEEASGITAMRLAARALREGEIDAALAGAVDLSHEPVHNAALAELGLDAPAGDAAVVLALKRLDDARRDGDPVFATLDACDGTPALLLGDTRDDGARVNLTDGFGKPHAAHGLLHVAAAALALRHGAKIRSGGAAMPWFGERAAEVSVRVLEAPPVSVHLRGLGEAQPWVDNEPAHLHVFSGADRAAVLSALDAGQESRHGPARLVIVAANAPELRRRGAQARRWVLDGGPPPEGVAFRETPIAGETAMVFTGAAASYPGMGRELVLALPKQVGEIVARCPEIQPVLDAIYRLDDGKLQHPVDQLWGTAFISQLHAEITLRLLNMEPSAVIGYSSGETNALYAMGVWNDPREMINASRSDTIFTSDLAGSFDAPRRSWQRLGVTGAGWSNYLVAAQVEQVRALLADEPLVHLTIINTAEDCVIGGESAACERVVQRLGRGRTLSLEYDMAVHCPEVGEVRDAWWQLHRRDVREVPGVRFYTNATNNWYIPTPESAADAITRQALHTVDFPKTIEQAWEDGVRVFIEHGPRSQCGSRIRRILGEREHLVVSLDAEGRSGLRQLFNSLAWLVAAGVEADISALEAEIAAARPQRRPLGRDLVLPAHPPAPRTPAPPPLDAGKPVAGDACVMQRAPVLEPLLTGKRHGRDLLHPEMPVFAEAAQWAVPAPSTSAIPTSRNLPDVIARMTHVSALHQAYIEQMTEAHRHFMAVQQAAEATLHRAFGAAMRPVALDAVALAAPLPAGCDGSSARVPPPPAPARPAAAPALLDSTVSAPDRLAPPPRKETEAKPLTLPGPKFDRAQLEMLASGKISSVFGPAFAGQDQYARQVRMPEPPLLLADRVTGIDAAPGSMGKGTLWTETDVRTDSWYLNDDGRMPAGIMIESGQADLLLISWLGIDALNKGERVYRLLGCDLIYHQGLPSPGDTLAFDIHVDGHARHGDVRLFFFHYDCRIRGETRLSVRNGQAGFFSDQELADSAGVLWQPQDETPRDGPVDAPAVRCSKRRFSQDEVAAFAAGRAFECFGPGYELAQTHVRTPHITAQNMRFLDEVTQFDVSGGPWGRGYLRAETRVTPEDWYFKGHFKNDPCMPGTLMFEGCLQAMAIYIAALGYTLERDGWRFEPVPDEHYSLRCRGQVTPSSKRVVYEIFVSEVIAGPIPTLYADLLGTVDGRKAFHARRVGLRLVPDWPMEHWRHQGAHAAQLTGKVVPLMQLGGLAGYREPKPVATVEGFKFDYASLLACAWGKPSHAFGPFYRPFDGPRRAARLPGPPYHFMSRVTQLDGAIGGMKSGTGVEVEYDVPAQQWYFEQNGSPAMPFCVLMEAALQPCGWLASYTGCALTNEAGLLFRNLDGTGTLFREVLPGSGSFRTRVRLLSISQSAGMIILNFEVECFLGDERAFEMKTVFGFFPVEAFENQLGLPVTQEERARMEAPPVHVIDLVGEPEKYCGGALRLPGRMLRMLDRVVESSLNGGKKALGYLRAEKTVNAGEWFFKAHFFQDPVQPGSLGIEALCQLLQFYMLEAGMAKGIADPRFEPLMLERPVTWKYRGQVVPGNKLISTEIQIVEIGTDDRGKFAIAEGWLWVDGKRIYSAHNMGMRIVSGA